jgi:hypothetical protein
MDDEMAVVAHASAADKRKRLEYAAKVCSPSKADCEAAMARLPNPFAASVEPK